MNTQYIYVDFLDPKVKKLINSEVLVNKISSNIINLLKTFVESNVKCCIFDTSTDQVVYMINFRNDTYIIDDNKISYIDIMNQSENILNLV